MPHLTTVKHLAIAGILGQISFELYAWFISPVLFGPVLEPSNLVMGLTAKFTGLQISYGSAFVLHSLIGAFGFAALVYLVKKITSKGYALSGFIAGFALWFTAQGILAPLLGRSFMMGFGAYTQSSFVSHVGMTVIIALIWQWLAKRGGQSVEQPA